MKKTTPSTTNHNNNSRGRDENEVKADLSSVHMKRGGSLANTGAPLQTPLQSTPQPNYGGTSKQQRNQEEQETPLLSQYDNENLFQSTPLFSTQRPGTLSMTESPNQQGYSPHYDHVRGSTNRQDAELAADGFLTILPTMPGAGSTSTLSSSGSATQGSSGRLAVTGSDPSIGHMVSLHPDGTSITRRSTEHSVSRSVGSRPQQPQPQLTNWQSIKRMLARMAPEKGKITIGVIAMMIGSLCTLLIPLAIGKLVDIVGKDGAKFKDIRWILYAAMVAIVINAFANFISLSTLSVAGDKVVAVLRLELFKSLIYRDISFFDTSSVGELLSRLSVDVGAINQALTVDIAEGFQRLAVMSGSIVYMLYISWDMCLLVFILAPVIGISASRLARLFHLYAARVNDVLAQSTIVAQETLANMRTVRSLGLEYTQQLRYNEKIITSYRLNRTQKLMRSGQRTFVYFAAGCAVVGLLWYGSWKVIERQLTSGSLLSFVILGLNVGENIGKMLDNYTNISSSAAACSEALNLVDAGKSNTQLFHDFKDLTTWHRTTNDVDFDQLMENLNAAGSNTDLVSRRGENGRLIESVTAGTTLILDDTTIPILPKINFNVPITFEGVHFTYPSRPGQPVLLGVDMTIAPCSQNAFVGASGSGKSSAMALLLQMYHLNGGQIKLGSTNISSINPVLWRSSIGYVEQSPTLFNTTILENVLMGVSNFKLHDCNYTITQLKAERENQKKFFPTSATTHTVTHIDDIESRNPHQRRNHTNNRRSSTDLLDDEEIICPCRSSPDLPLCQDLFGKQYTMRDVEKACRMANAHDFITEFPEGYYTRVNGLAVSGGQAQRISISRAFLRDAQLILLDEVSSALDPINEEQIISALNNLCVGKTVITIAHRLSTIKHLGQTNPNDTIFVYKGGNIAERGTHQALMTKEGGEFRKLSELQALVAAATH